MAEEWYCKISGEESGPLSVQAIKTMAAEGQLLPEDLVRRGAAGAWIPAGRMKGLFPAADSPPAPAAPLPPSTPDSRSKRLPKARPVAKPISEPRSPSPPIARSRGTSPPPPAPIPGGKGGGPSASPPSAGAPRAQGAGEFDFLEDGYSAAPGPPSATASTAIEAMEKKRQAQRRIQMILLVVMGSLVLVLLALMLFLFFRNRNPAPGPEAAATKAADSKVEESAEPKTAGEKAETEEKAADRTKKTEKPAAAKKEAPSAKKKEAEPVWINASVRSAPVGDITVRIVSAEVKSLAPGQKLLYINFDLSNENKAGKILEYTSWNTASTGIRLVDDVGNSYSLGKAPGAAGEAKKAIYPKEKVEDQLIFQRPVETAKYLHLTLPASAFGEKGSVHFELPMSMVERKSAEPEATKSSESAPGKRAESGRGFAGLSPAAAAPAPASPAPPAKPERNDEEDEKPTENPERDFGISPKSMKPGKLGPGDPIPDPEPAEKAMPGGEQK